MCFCKFTKTKLQKHFCTTSTAPTHLIRLLWTLLRSYSMPGASKRDSTRLSDNLVCFLFLKALRLQTTVVFLISRPYKRDNSAQITFRRILDQWIRLSFTDCQDSFILISKCIQEASETENEPRRFDYRFFKIQNIF